MSKKYKESKGYKGTVQKISYWQLINTWYGGNLTHNDSSMKKVYLNSITKVIFNDPATIVFWRDGTKTVVKCNPEDKFDPEKGLAMACMKKLFGNNGFYNDIFRKWLPEEESGLLAPKEMLDVIGKIAIGATIHDKYKNLLNEAMVREKAKFEDIPSVFKNFATLIDKEEDK